jgi:hypothetical protein
MPDTTQLTETELLRRALIASREMTSHMHQVFGGWDECKPCEKANDECDGSFSCAKYKQWKKQIEAGLFARPSGAEAVVQELRLQLATAERQASELGSELAKLRRDYADLERALGLNEEAAA